MDFKLWSDTNPESRMKLNYNLGYRFWDELTFEEKRILWLYFPIEYLKKEIVLHGVRADRAEIVIAVINSRYKYHAFARNYLSDPSKHNAHSDFQYLFLNEVGDIVFELITQLGLVLIKEQEIKVESFFPRKEDEEDVAFEERKSIYIFSLFDKYAEKINDIFQQFGVNYQLTRLGFVPCQDSIVETEIWDPVLHCLSNDKKFDPVNRDLKDAFTAFRQNNEQGFSNCITHTISAIEAYLQVILHSRADGKGTLGELIDEAKSKNVFKNFPIQVIESLKSYFAKERKLKSDAHVKLEYATKKSSLLAMNLAIVFLQTSFEDK